VSSQPPISGTTAIVGVLGDPVHHSLSPVMQNAALQAMGLDWVFLALPAPAGELATAWRPSAGSSAPWPSGWGP